MINMEYEYFKSLAKIASEALDTMAILWEQMQYNGTEPDTLDFPESYPFDKSFDDIAEAFNYWVGDL